MDQVAAVKFGVDASVTSGPVKVGPSTQYKRGRRQYDTVAASIMTGARFKSALIRVRSDSTMDSTFSKKRTTLPGPKADSRAEYTRTAS